jgi:N6-adenosine-specific RNA methylase IME4
MLAGQPLIAGLPANYTGPLIEDGLFAGMPKHYASALYLDPAIKYRTWSERGQGRSPLRHYDCMYVEDVIALGPEIKALCASTCVMVQWWPNPHADKMAEFMTACGFEYRSTAFVWAKLAKGHPGISFTPEDFPIRAGKSATRKQTEIAWYGRRGAPKRQDKDIRELVFAPSRQHSRKPDEIYGRIERLFPGPYVELFARQHVPGWISWGNEVEKFEFIGKGNDHELD